jgi:uncharacterized protein YkwD
MKTVDRSRRILVAACFVAFCAILHPAIEVAAQSPGLSEDCIAFDVNRAQVRRYSASWKLVVGTLWLRDFGENETEARKALEVIKHYGLNMQCFVGRPNPSLEYYLADGRAPNGPLAGEDCLDFNPAKLEIKKSRGRWKIAEEDRWLLDFGSSRSEAEKALEIIHAYDFTSLCYVGRPDPSFTYFRTGQAVASEPSVAETTGAVLQPSARLPVSIRIYGSSSCGRCKSMQRSLDQAGIAYEFFDINLDSEQQAELWRHVNRAHPGTQRVSLPVVVIEEVVLINPSFEEVRRELTSASRRNETASSASAQAGESAWEENLYARYDHISFFTYAPAQQRIQLNDIDYPLLRAALFYETNRVRLREGHPALAYHAGCSAAAQMHARDMAMGKFFSHENPEDASKRTLKDRVARFDIRWSWLAENINQGMGNGTYIEVARQYVDSWMNSSGHRANMLSDNATHMGTGAYNAGSKYSDLYFDAVQVFARIID